MGSREKRVHPRQDHHEEITFVVEKDRDSSGLSPTGEFAGLLTDSSVTGFGFMTSAPVKPGQQVRLIEKPEWWPHTDQGVVMWTAEATDGTRVGVQFVAGLL